MKNILATRTINGTKAEVDSKDRKGSMEESRVPRNVINRLPLGAINYFIRIFLSAIAWNYLFLFLLKQTYCPL